VTVAGLPVSEPPARLPGLQDHDNQDALPERHDHHRAQREPPVHCRLLHPRAHRRGGEGFNSPDWYWVLTSAVVSLVVVSLVVLFVAYYVKRVAAHLKRRSYR